MPSMSVAPEVSSDERSSEASEGHLQNMYPMSSTREVSHSERSRDASERQLRNMS